MKIVLIGAGRLATNLGHALLDAGHDIQMVYSRTQASAKTLADSLHTAATTDIAQLPLESDCQVLKQGFSPARRSSYCRSVRPETKYTRRSSKANRIHIRIADRR